jgi:hypothetical protein
MSNTEIHFYCPACGEADRIDVETESSVRVNSEGEIDWHYDDNGSSHHWDGGSRTSCRDCGYDGVWENFEHEISFGDERSLMRSALGIATGGMEILSDGQLGELFKQVGAALRIAQNGWRHDELGACEAVVSFEAKLSAIGGEMNRRGLAQ